MVLSPDDAEAYSAVYGHHVHAPHIVTSTTFSASSGDHEQAHQQMAQTHQQMAHEQAHQQLVLEDLVSRGSDLNDYIVTALGETTSSSTSKTTDHDHAHHGHHLHRHHGHERDAA